MMAGFWDLRSHPTITIDRDRSGKLVITIRSRKLLLGVMAWGFVLLLLAGCQTEAVPAYTGPASLQVVPPSYYSSRPYRRSRAPEPTVARKIGPQRQRPAHEARDGGDPAELNEIEERADEISQRIRELRQKLD